MDANRLRKANAARVILIRLGFILLLLTLALGMVVWRAPLWVGAEITLFRLSAAGFHKRSTAINGYHVFYLEGGPHDGAPVVLVHGLGATMGDNWGYISPLLAARGYCVFALTYGLDPRFPYFGGVLPIEQSAP